MVIFHSFLLVYQSTPRRNLPIDGQFSEHVWGRQWTSNNRGSSRPMSNGITLKMEKRGLNTEKNRNEPPIWIDGFWLVVEPPLWKILRSVGIILPNIWKNNPNVPNHQPGLYHVDHLFVRWFEGWLRMVYDCLTHIKQCSSKWGCATDKISP